MLLQDELNHKTLVEALKSLKQSNEQFLVNNPLHIVETVKVDLKANLNRNILKATLIQRNLSVTLIGDKK